MKSHLAHSMSPPVDDINLSAQTVVKHHMFNLDAATTG
jgi:hypothetical protein